MIHQIPGAFIDFYPELSADKVACREILTQSRPESPKESFQGYEPVSHSFPSSHFTVQGTPGVGITSIDTSPFAIPPVIPHFPYLEDVHQRGIYSPTGRTGTGFGVAGANLEAQASTSALFTSRRDAPAALPSPATSSPRISFDSKAPGTEVNQATSLTFEDG